MKVQWKGPRWNQVYIINAAFDEVPTCPTNFGPDHRPTFTLAPEHKDGLYSMEQLFLERYTDPTEQTFIEDVFEGDAAHWEAMKNSRWIGKYYRKWKQKAEARLLSEAMTKIVETAFDPSNRNSFNALKYLVERGTKADKKTNVGRPKKEKEVETVSSKDLLADIERLKGQ